MALANVQTPYQTFTDARGKIISLGKVYIGVSGQDPETNPINVYWDSAGTILAAQPLTIINGYINRSGTPAQVFCNSDYSIRLYDSTNSVVYYFPSILAKTIDGPAGGVLTGTYPNPDLADAAVTSDKIADNAVLNNNIVPGLNNTIKATLGSIVVDATAYQLNDILGRVGMTEYCEHSAWDVNLYYWMNGGTLSRTDDARLFAKVSSLLGTQGSLGWGVGDGSTTFTLPDRRGLFNRGFSNNNSIDPDGGTRVIGSKQDDASQGHKHNMPINQGVNFAPAGDYLKVQGTIDPAAGVYTGSTSSTPITDGTNGTPRTAIETRPINAATYWLVVR